MTGRASADVRRERASADLLIDRRRLSEILGREVRATRLRFKPGLSTTAVLLDAVGDDAPGWIQVSHPRHLDKLRNAVELAQERGQRVHLLEADGLTIAHGTIDTDPRLQKGLDALRTAHTSVAEGVSSGRLRVLRYNPQRRLVLRQEVPHEDARHPDVRHPDVRHQDAGHKDAGHKDAGHQDALVLRVTTGKQRGVRSALAALAAAGIPVVEPLRTGPRPRNERVSVWPWFGSGDLASLTSDSEGPARAAGAALARLHLAQLPAALPGAGAGSTSGPATGAVSGIFAPVPDTVGALSALAGDLLPLDSAAAERLRTIVARLAGPISHGQWLTGLTHGDFSADQVLVGGPGEDTVRLTDFDRAGHGPLMADLGSFAAAELLETAHAGALDAGALDAGGLDAGVADSGDPGSRGPFSSDLEALPLTRALLAGYATAGGPARDRAHGEGLRLWTARALLTRVQEPFRGAEPDWVAAINHRLDQVSEVLR